jgi:hypothetical protein
MADAEKLAEALAVVWTRWLTDEEESAQRLGGGGVRAASSSKRKRSKDIRLEGEEDKCSDDRGGGEHEKESEASPVPAIRLDFLVCWSPERRGEAQVHTLEVTECGFSTWSWAEGEAAVFEAIGKHACRPWLNVVPISLGAI